MELLLTKLDPLSRYEGSRPVLTKKRIDLCTVGSGILTNFLPQAVSKTSKCCNLLKNGLICRMEFQERMEALWGSVFSGEMGSTLRIFSGSLGFSYIHCPPSLLSGYNLSLAELAKLPTTQQAVTHHPSLIYLAFFLVFKEVSFGTISVALNQLFSSITLLSSTHESPARLAKCLAYFQALSASS
jgi:hypothetical protein